MTATSEHHPVPAHATSPSAGVVDASGLAARFECAVESAGNRLAVADSRGRELSRAGLWQEASALSRELAANGVRPGHAVLIMLPNLVEWQVTFLATLIVGAVPASIPTATDQATLRHAIDLCAPAAIVAPRRHRKEALADFAAEAARQCDSGPAVLTLEADGARTWRQPHPAPSGGVVHPAELDHVMFTSSTTGRPKAVMHTDGSAAAINIGVSERYGLGADTPILMPAPLGHSIGAVHGARMSLFLGAPLVLQECWDPEEAIALSARYGCRFSAIATPFLRDLLEAPAPAEEPKLASLHTLICGGAPVSAALMEQAVAQLPRTFVTALWGMTEGGVTTCPPDSPREKRGPTAGKPIRGFELRVGEVDDAEAARAGVGELLIRGPQMFFGYLGDDGLRESMLTADGYFRTGDLASIDDDGYLRLDGRLKDLIIRGGVNISPVPLEHALAQHPAVAAVAVIGAPDARLGERICAVVVPRRGAAPQLESLIEWAGRQGLARRQWPEELRIVDDLPRTAGGKVRKHLLRDRLYQARPT